MIDDLVAGADDRRQHVPVRRIDAAREVPETADEEAAVDAAPLALRGVYAGGDQRVRILSPDFLLGARVVEGEEPVMDREIGHVPCGRCAAAADLSRDVEERDEGQLHAAPSPRLVKAEEPCAVELRFRLLRHLAECFGAGRALAERGDQRVRPRHRLVVAHVLKAHRRGKRRTTCRVRASERPRYTGSHSYLTGEDTMDANAKKTALRMIP